jgi:hypothetical protein
MGQAAMTLSEAFKTLSGAVNAGVIIVKTPNGRFTFVHMAENGDRHTIDDAPMFTSRRDASEALQSAYRRLKAH